MIDSDCGEERGVNRDCLMDFVSCQELNMYNHDSFRRQLFDFALIIVSYC